MNYNVLVISSGDITIEKPGITKLKKIMLQYIMKVKTMFLLLPVDRVKDCLENNFHQLQHAVSIIVMQQSLVY